METTNVTTLSSSARTYMSAGPVCAHAPVFLVLDPEALHMPPQTRSCVLGWNAPLPDPLVKELNVMSGPDRVRLFCGALKAVGVSMQNCSQARQPCAVARQNLLDLTVMYGDQWSFTKNIFSANKCGAEYFVLGLRLWYRPDLDWGETEGRMCMSIQCECPPVRPTDVAIDVWDNRVYCGKVMGKLRIEHEPWLAVGRDAKRGVRCARAMVLMAQPSPFPVTARCGVPPVQRVIERPDSSSEDEGGAASDSDSGGEGGGFMDAGTPVPGRGLFDSDSDSEYSSSSSDESQFE